MESEVKSELVVAIAGVTGAVGADSSPRWKSAGFQWAIKGTGERCRSAGKTLAFRGQKVAIEELAEIHLKASTSRCSRRAAVFPGNFTHCGECRRRRGRQLLRLPHGAGGAAGDPRSMAIRIRNTGVSLRSELLHDHGAGALWPIHKKRTASAADFWRTYQAASGAGAAAMEELMESTRAHLAGQVYQPSVLPHSYAFNLFNHNSAIDLATANDEETKSSRRPGRLFEDDRIAVGVTCVRVPGLRAHSEAITFECEHPIKRKRGARDPQRGTGVRIVDDRRRTISRCRSTRQARTTCWSAASPGLSDPSGHSISMFVAADQLLKGAP